MAVTPIWDPLTATDPGTRAGVYINFESEAPPAPVVSSTGTVAAVLPADWGPVETPFAVTNTREINRYFGTSAASKERAAILEMLRSGASKIIVFRVADANVATSTLTLNDTAGTPAAALTVTAKYPGAFGDTLKVAVQTNLADGTKKDLIVYEGTTVRETFTGQYNSDIVSMVALLGSNYVNVALAGTAGRVLANITATSLTGGNSGRASLVSSDFVDGWTGTQGEVYSTIAVATDDPAIQASFCAWVRDRRDSGYRIRGFVGSGAATSFADKLTAVSGFDDEGFHYVVNDYVTQEGVNLPPFWASFTAAAIASVRAYHSVTNYTVEGATQGSISLSAAEYKLAITRGMFVWSWAGDRLYIEAGINTLQPGSQVAPKSTDWRKMRYIASQDWLAESLWQALMADYVGKVENDERGREEAVRIANEVVARAVQLRILDSGEENSAYLDDRYDSTKDRVFLALSGSFVDAIEKFFFTAVI